MRERVIARQAPPVRRRMSPAKSVENWCMDDNKPDEIDLTAPDVDLVMMELLRAHVPLSLLIDLAYPEGPHSREILAAEAG